MRPRIADLVRKDAVHRAIYTDPEIYALEMERIFDRVWVYLGLAAEIPNEGDYVTTTLGRHPIILTRLADGKVGAVVNRCRHRGPTLCHADSGNARFFRCPYHNWTYDLAGKLIGVPMPAGYGKSFDRDSLGLVPVPRVAEYRGFIFGSMAPSGPTLEAYLGGICRFLDAYVETSPGRRITLFEGQQKVGYAGNWKFQLENGVDPYHVGALHASAASKEAMQIYREGSGCVIAMDGHGVTDHTDYGPMPVDASLSGGFNLVIFPNLIVLRSQIRTVRPVAPDRTEILTRVVKLEGVPDDVNTRRLRDQEFEFGAAGTFYTDDVEIFERAQEGLQSTAADWVVVARGLDREIVRDGYVTGGMSDETQHRGMYQHWHRLMLAGEAEAAAGAAA